ncbi:hypothetical protein [Sporomusa acidovorans]|nr:hypothetical protein [Sporomusa acidovorans]
MKKVTVGQDNKFHPADTSDKFAEWNKLFFGTPYLVENGRLVRVSEDRNGDKKKICLASFAAKIIKEVVRDNGQDEATEFVIEGITSSGRKLKRIHVPTSKFSSMIWAVDSWGAVANPSPGSTMRDYLRHAIQCTGESCQRETIYGHLGWRKIGGKWFYLHGAGAVGDLDGKLSVDLTQDNLQQYALPTAPGDYRSAVQASLKLLTMQPLETFYTLWATVYLAPLCELMRLGGCEPSFLIWLLGHSGAMKSSVAALILNHFGVFPDKLALPANFKDTANILERKTFLVKDSLLVVDDFHPPTNRKEEDRMRESVQRLSRGYGDRHGRSRMNSDTTTKKAYVARGMCLVTGEDLGNIGESAGARQIVVELKKGDIDSGTMTARQGEARCYSLAMKGYLEWLIPQLDKLPKQFKEDFIALRQQAADDSQHARVAEEISWLYMGFCTGLEFAEQVGALDLKEKEALCRQAWNIFTELGNKQAAKTREEKITTRFVSALQELLDSKTVWVKNIRGNSTEGNGQFIGWFDDKFYYLITGTALSAVVKHYQSQGGFFTTTTATLLKRLAQEEMIHSENGTASMLKKIEGKAVRVMYLRKEFLKS